MLEELSGRDSGGLPAIRVGELRIEGPHDFGVRTDASFSGEAAYGRRTRRPAGAAPLDEALRTDRKLRAADRGAALGRRALGLLAKRFLAIQGYNGLGFSCVGDWSRERVGLSGREIQVLAKVFSDVESLPRIESAFLSGEISWTKLRILSSVATTDDSERWLALASHMTTRELEAEARKVAKASIGTEADTVSREGGARARKVTTALTEISDDEGETVEGEERASFRLSVSRRLLRLWNDVLELSRRMNGANGPVWKLAEAIAAEGLSAVPAEAVDEENLRSANACAQDRGQRTLRVPCPRNGTPGRRASGTSPAQSDTGEAAGDVPLEKSSSRSLMPGLSRDEPGHHDVLPLRQAQGERREARGEREEARSEREKARATVDTGNSEATVDRGNGDGFSLDLDAILDCVDDLDCFTLDVRMRRVVRALNLLEVGTSRLLRRMADRRLHVALGYPRLDDYARERLGVSARTVWNLVAVARKSFSVPALDRALREGKLSRARALALLPVLSPRDPEAASAWVDRASRVMVRRVADEVDWVLDSAGDSAASSGGSVPAPASQAESARFATAPSPRLLPPPLDSRLERPELQMRAPRAERNEATIAFSGPASVIALFRITAKAFDPTGGDFRAGLERLLWHVRDEWRGSQPRDRDPILERDGWRCTVPGCSKRNNFHGHHMIERRHNGPDDPWNLTAVCAWHHLRGIHKGLVRCRGRAPDQIHWELGVTPGNQPSLLELEGDVYVVRGAEGVAAA